MRSLNTSRPFCKRRQPEHPSKPSERPSKRQQLDHSASAYWDNLSTIHLTRSAIKELDRRNSSAEPPQTLHRPNTRYFLAEQNNRRHCPAAKPIPPTDFLSDCSPSQLKEINRLSRFGGPDLSDLKSYPYPTAMSSTTSSSRRKRRAESPPSSSTRGLKTTTKTTSTTYSRNFQQNLIDHGVYPEGYEYPNGQIPSTPNNMKDIIERLAQPRRSLSPTKFSDEDFRQFKRADTHASKEKPVTTTVIPILDGNIDDPKCVGGNYLFGNLAPLTDGTLSSAKPDHFFGTRPEQLKRPIRQALSDQIIPSTQHDLPMAPNFFLEAKGPDGSLAVVTRQACYDGALSARGIHALQSYRQEPVYDNNAYTLTSTYHGGTLKLYTTHISQSDDPDYHHEYFMTQVKGWSLTSDVETFRQGASAYRNARDWAKEKRDEFIRTANERFHDNPQSSPVSQHQASGLITILDDSDESTEPAGYEDAVE
ncbi:hypothetical protein ACJ72_07154 [Emergomyces africanus]|uniref:Uncharacterized protein n=1 Tax=Emergomyces africanus TaxID=1955775 RepID=A0A1B7NPG9_9EURO|nr:hypothetical protein ACJ72_07154 [Emergomyces africanus]